MYIGCNAADCQHLQTSIFPRTDGCGLQETYSTSWHRGLRNFLLRKKRKYILVLAFRNREFWIARQAERNNFLKRLILQFSLHNFGKLIQHTLCILSHCHVYNFLRSVAIFQNVFHPRSFARVILKIWHWIACKRLVADQWSNRKNYECWNFNSGNYLFTTDTR